MYTQDSESPFATAERLAAAFEVPHQLLKELHDLHACQWRLEDESRRSGASPHEVARAKNKIDACNHQRHRLVDVIDAAAVVTGKNNDPRYYSETVGELADRLIILDLKWQTVGSNEIRRICIHLAILATQLIEDAATGSAVLPPRVGTKIYNGAVA